MKLWTFLLICFLCLATAAPAQVYRFKHIDAFDRYDASYDSAGLSCFFRFSGKKDEPTLFHKVFLDDYLRPWDSITISAPGRARLLDSYVGETSTAYVLYCKEKKSDFIQFIFQWKSGATRNKFVLTADQLVMGIKKASHLAVSIVESDMNADRIILRLRYVIQGQVRVLIAAYRISDGGRLWDVVDNLSSLITTENEIVALREPDTYGDSDATLVILNKQTGGIIRSVPLNKESEPRDISVFTTNGAEIMIVGNAWPSKRAKSGSFYMTLYDLTGSVILDRVDTTASLSSQRMHTLGHVFDNNGNLIIVGEGWKLDYTRMIATTALSIALIAMGGRTVMMGRPDHKITSLFMASLSTETGRLIDFSSFPVGPWMNWSHLISDGQRVMIRNGSRFLTLDPENRHLPPHDFSGDGNVINTFMTPYGPVMLLLSPGTISLKKM